MASIIKADKWQTSAGVTRSTVLQTLHYRGTVADISITTGWAWLVTGSITISEGSKIYADVHSGQIIRTNTIADYNPQLFMYYVAGSSITTNASPSIYFGMDPDHLWYGAANGSSGPERIFTLNRGLTGNLTAGTYTVGVTCSIYNSTGRSMTFNAQGTGRAAALTLMEVQG